MSNSSKNWSKHELKIYLLLLCAQADSVQTEDELEIIKHKTNSDTFASIYQEFKMDDEDTSIEKIETSIGRLEFSQMELADLKKEFNELFHSDKKFSAAEHYLVKILDNILY
ncbi:hypothetical protein [Maribacter sp. ACAM166]|uniref:hypothetical protein n=1 Tax=Maribacter sp. ACAM166 TaxID=2508996 RepID=UPI0010FEB74A|nr:hypothetical protein [Maribacter sp. ACAM166]TLP80249.1 hypothetical protein ES765_08645 [Maribacter sp. ACAM166]